MMTSVKVAIVTGSNKGIGYEIVKKIGALGGIRTIIATRDTSRGEEAVFSLKKQGYDVDFIQLDISSSESIENFTITVKNRYEKVDILVNNAAIAFKGSDSTPFEQQARPTIQTNFCGTLELTRSLLPLLKRSENPRIVNIASQAGHLRIIPDAIRRRFFTSSDLTMNKLEEAMNEFVVDVESGRHTELGWPNTCYGTSKLGVIAMTKILARDEPEILVNCCCPGYCQTGTFVNTHCS